MAPDPVGDVPGLPQPARKNSRPVLPPAEEFALDHSRRLLIIDAIDPRRTMGPRVMAAGTHPALLTSSRTRRDFGESTFPPPARDAASMSRELVEAPGRHSRAGEIPASQAEGSVLRRASKHPLRTVVHRGNAATGRVSKPCHGVNREAISDATIRVIGYIQARGHGPGDPCGRS